MICRYYGHCPRDPDTGEVLCHHGWRDSCPMEGVEEDEDGILVNTVMELEKMSKYARKKALQAQKGGEK